MKETDKTALRTTKLAAKLVVQLGKAGARASAGGLAIPVGESNALLQPGNLDIMAEALNARAAAGRTLGDGGVDLGRGPGSKPTKREMGLLKWGKKGHKVGNKDPYGNADLETAASLAPAGAKVAAGGKKGRRGKKRDEFTRVTLPHHHTYSGPT